MRKRKPMIGERRLVKKFLLFPMELGGEIRWLETVMIDEKYCMLADGDGNPFESWMPVRFID